MAQFQEVMRQLNRLCSHFQNCNENGCPMFDECGNIGAHCSDPKHTYRIEKTVMSWAAEHPEPVYPTWVDWFREMGVIPSEQKCFHIWLLDTIPADIAQKLGVKPKEDA